MGSVEGAHTVRKPVLDHVRELQARLTLVVLTIVVCGVAAYLVNDALLVVIQKPLGQTLYYTSPAGGFSFVLKLSVAAGIVLALPMVLYQLFKFLTPLLARPHRLLIVSFVLWSINLAYAGVLFAYSFSLPAALHFLAEFGGEGIQSLITADEYFNFALAYLAGFAVLFQLPLIVLFINKIKPLKPSKMMAAQRYVILGSFIIAAILTPTPDPLNQAIMAAPAIVLYQASIIFTLIFNYFQRRRKPVSLRTKTIAPRLASPQAKTVDFEPEPALAPAGPHLTMDVVLR